MILLASRAKLENDFFLFDLGSRALIRETIAKRAHTQQ